MSDPAALQQLLAEIEAEARRAEFPIDVETYEKFGKDPLAPVAYAGSFTVPLAVVRWPKPDQSLTTSSPAASRSATATTT